MNFIKKRDKSASIQEQFLDKSSDLVFCRNLELEKNFTQHRGTTVYEHSIGVAYMSYRLASFLPFSFREDALIKGALLHDYFLYDWHVKDPSHKWHGFCHPKIAKEKAESDFGLTKVEANIICRHMFPLTPIPPRYKESFLVSIMDKICAVCEMLNIQYLPSALIDQLV